MIIGYVEADAYSKQPDGLFIRFSIESKILSMVFEKTLMVKVGYPTIVSGMLTFQLASVPSEICPP